MTPFTRRSFLKTSLLMGSSIVAGWPTDTPRWILRRLDTDLTNEQIAGILEKAMSKGVGFSEVFVENSVIHTLSLKARALDQKREAVRGLGLRGWLGAEDQYVWTEDLSDKGISDVIAQLKGGRAEQPARTVPLQEISFPTVSPVKQFPSDSTDQTIEYLRMVESAAYGCDRRVKDVILVYQHKLQDVTIANSQSLLVRGKRCDIMLVAIVIAEDLGSQALGASAIGGTSGTEVLTRESAEQLAREASDQAVRLLNPRTIPQKKLPIIFANRSAVFHECLGHPLEARHREGAFRDKLGVRLTSVPLTVIDDATIAGFGGSYAFDDEGTQSTRTLLIEEGVLKGFLYDRLYAERYNAKTTGNGRRMSFRFRPIPRMSNLMIKPGEASFDDLVKDTKEGILALATLGGGRSFVNEGKFLLPFYGAFHIENGKITDPLQPFVYQGNILRTLENIDALGNDYIQSTTGRCGLDQIITVTYSGPSAKIKESDTLIPLDPNVVISSARNLKL